MRKTAASVVLAQLNHSTAASLRGWHWLAVCYSSHDLVSFVSVSACTIGQIGYIVILINQHLSNIRFSFVILERFFF